MAAPQTLIIWEKTAYCRAGEKGWLRMPMERPDDVISLVQEHFRKKSKITLLYDPEVMQTEFAECPPGGRQIAREALGATHESITNMHTAWGLQIPWQLAGSGGSYGTFCSYETVPTLYSLITTLRELGYVIDVAFPLTSLGSQMGESQGRTNIFLVIDKTSQAFVYLHTATGMRAARKLYAGKRQGEYDVWNEISLVFGEYGITFDDGGQRPQVRVYQAPGTDIKTQCPYWPELHNQAQTEVMSFDALDITLKALQTRHPSFLMADMPKFIDMDFGFQITMGVLAALLLGFGIYAYIDLGKDNKELRALKTQDSSLAVQEARLRSNKAEIEKLDGLYAQEIFEASQGRIRLLELLPTAIPRTATLTQASIGTKGGVDFRLSGVFWNWQSMIAPKGKNILEKSAAATAATPFTAIKSTLESSIQGLLIPPADNQIQASGDFIIQGTTPRPEPLVAASKPATPAKPATSAKSTRKK